MKIQNQKQFKRISLTIAQTKKYQIKKTRKTPLSSFRFVHLLLGMRPVNRCDL